MINIYFKNSEPNNTSASKASFSKPLYWNLANLKLIVITIVNMN